MRRIVTGVNSEGRSYVMAVDEIPPPQTGRPNIWASDPKTTATFSAAIKAEEVPAGIEPPSGASKVIIGQGAEDGKSQRGWHSTRTVDYYYLLGGKVTLELDEGSVEVNAGDLVIQQATRHRWKGHGAAPWQYLVVLHAL
jgi:quercetin dioxygenase-like cupin family protein